LTGATETGLNAPSLLGEEILDSLPQHIAVIDTNARIVWVNRAWMRFAEENGGAATSLGPGCNYLTACENSASGGDTLAASAAAGVRKVISGEHRHFALEYPCHAPGERRWFLMSVTPVADDARSRRAVITHHDITQRKLAELEKDKYFGIITHELRTPLTSIKGSVSLLGSGAVPHGSTEFSTTIGMLLRNCDRVDALIDDILDAESLASGEMTFNFGVVDMASLVTDAVFAEQGFAQHRGIDLSTGVSNAEAHVEGDMKRLGQVLANLLSNAIKFSPEGGQVRVDMVADHHEVRISVRDNGRGITEDAQKRLFERFSRLGSTKERDEVPGSGLGLYISKSIVEAHGGTIGFTADPAGGTEFFFVLPALRQPKQVKIP